MNIPGIAGVFPRKTDLLILQNPPFPVRKIMHLGQGWIPIWPAICRQGLVVAVCALSLASSSQAIAQPFLMLHSLAAGPTNVSGIFTNGDGAHPFAGLAFLGTTLYGTAQDGGNSGKGTVFSVSIDGKAFTILHSFTPTVGTANVNTDGAIPQGRLIVVSNTLYGSTIAGGSGGVGTVFAVNIDGSGFATLHNFTGIQAAGEGAYPSAGLALLGNTLYGTTSEGGSSGNGTVFAVNIDGTGFRTVYSFAASHTNTSGLYTNSDGARPSADLILNTNTLFGTAAQGGSAGKGTVFAIQTDGSGFTNLHNFTGLSDGADPYAGLALSGNLLYGTTEFGGSTGNGTLFRISLSGAGFTTLHHFLGGNDGARPTSQLILSGNTVYGTAQFGGSRSNGTVFAASTDGISFSTLYSFNGSDGSFPYAGLVLLNNRLYGTATEGGSSSLGTVFGLSSDVAVSLPTLTIVRSGTEVALLWPTNAVGFALESAATLVPPVIWSPVPGILTVVNGQNAVTNPASGPQQFFRLIH
jgi:uncharacterized repeat protein (TIGR03803 family)